MIFIHLHVLFLFPLTDCCINGEIFSLVCLLGRLGYIILSWTRYWPSYIPFIFGKCMNIIKNDFMIKKKKINYLGTVHMCLYIQTYVSSM